MFPAFYALSSADRLRQMSIVSLRSSPSQVLLLAVQSETGRVLLNPQSGVLLAENDVVFAIGRSGEHVVAAVHSASASLTAEQLSWKLAREVGGGGRVCGLDRCAHSAKPQRKPHRPQVFHGRRIAQREVALKLRQQHHHERRLAADAERERATHAAASDRGDTGRERGRPAPTLQAAGSGDHRMSLEAILASISAARPAPGDGAGSRAETLGATSPRPRTAPAVLARSFSGQGLARRRDVAVPGDFSPAETVRKMAQNGGHLIIVSSDSGGDSWPQVAAVAFPPPSCSLPCLALAPESWVLQVEGILEAQRRTFLPETWPILVLSGSRPRHR